MGKIEKKLKKVRKSVKGAARDLLMLASKGAGKKKILKKATEIRSLEKDFLKLEKKLKSVTNDQKAKPAARKKKEKKKAGKPKAKKAAKNKKEHHISGQKTDEAKAKTRVPVGATVKKQTDELPSKKQVEKLSIDLAAKDAINRISGIDNTEELASFVLKEKRISVLSRAQSRMEALKKSH